MRLRWNYDIIHTPHTTVSNTIINTWINFMYVRRKHTDLGSNAACCEMYIRMHTYAGIHESKISLCQMHNRLCRISCWDSHLWFSTITHIQTIHTTVKCLVGICPRWWILVKDYTDTLHIKLVIPTFLKGRDQLSEEEFILSQQIASERIHVERMYDSETQNISYFW